MKAEEQDAESNEARQSDAREHRRSTAAELGDGIAEIYDDLFGNVLPNSLSVLAELAGAGGRALELGIGTGRVAIPLSNLGVEVHGVDASRAMVSKLREKAGGKNIPVTIADFSDPADVAGGPFSLVFCTFSTFFALLTQDDMVRSFQGVSTLLTPEGSFLIEAFVPDPSRFAAPYPALVGGLEADGALIDASRHHGITQRISTRLIRIKEGRAVKVIPIEIRYAWPSELDLMARIAGLRLAHRWAGWDKETLGPRSGMHISVYKR